MRRLAALRYRKDVTFSLDVTGLTAARLAAAIVLVAQLLFVLSSAMPASVDRCNDDSDSLALNLSSLRPDWYPKERRIQDYSAYAGIATPRLNMSSASSYAPCGDERRFLTIRQDGSEVHSRVQMVEQSKHYEVFIFLHNDDRRGMHESAPSVGTRVFLTLPEFLYESEKLTARIESDNSIPAIQSSAVVEPEIGVDSTFLYVESASFFNSAGEPVYSIPVEDVLGPQGALVGCMSADGYIPAGCYGTVRLKIVAKSLMRYIGTSVGDSPTGPWKNSGLIDDTSPVWVRYRFANVGELTLEDVKVQLSFDLKFPWGIYSDGNSLVSFIEGDKRPRQNVGLQDLVNGIEIGAVNVGDAFNVLVPIAPRSGWEDALCSNGLASVSTLTQSKNYIDSRTNVRFYPAASVCSK